MGLAWSSATPEEGNSAIGETTEATSTEAKAEESQETSDSGLNNGEETEDDERRKKREDDLIKFKEDLAAKREQAKKRLGEISNEMKGLNSRLEMEVTKRRALEEQLLKYKNGPEGFEEPGGKMSQDMDSLRISKYDDDEDDIDIIEEDDDKAKEESQEGRSKKRGVKKKVSFSLDLVKKEEFDPFEPHVEVAKDAHEELGKNEQEETDKPKEGIDNEATATEEADDVKELREKNKKLEGQVRALKDVANLSKQLLNLRETQVEELNQKLLKVDDKEKDLEKKMAAMQELRRLYDERGRAMIMEHKSLLEKERTKVVLLESKLRFAEDTNEDLAEKAKHLGEKVKNMDNQLDTVRSELSETKIKLATEKESLYHASSQISLINNLVSQIISGPELDLDHLARFLEDNHSLINELTAKGEIDYVASALVGVAGGIVEVPKEEKSDIAENLGKVWRVLIELLSHHKKIDSTNTEWESCYKSVDTPKGPKLVISVSQTFIKLKDLILEKNSLVKEVGRLKKLNDHLENRMEEQGNRLSLVTEELHDTWDVVNKLKRQHDSLHTHERILKHELQHKRSMLNGLKKQLEICREQWTLAREKNSKTENDWMMLRAEFAMRKQKKKAFSSAESGYDEEETASPEYDTDDDKSIDIEEESPDNSMGENAARGCISPSEVSSEDNCNGPISEVLDGIFHQACKIAEATPKTQTPVAQPFQHISSDQKSVVETEIFLEEETTSFNVADVSELDIFDLQNQTDRNYYNAVQAYCEYPGTRLEQIPEVEEDTSNDGSFKESDRIEIISITNYKDGVTIGPQDPELVYIDDEAGGNEQEETQSEEEVKIETGNPTTDEILRRREERLKRMEESCKSLFIKMGETSNRGANLSNKLDQIHAIYGPQEQEEGQSTSSQPTTQSQQSQKNLPNNETERQT